MPRKLLIEGEDGEVLVRGQQASFPVSAVGPPADEAAPGEPVRHRPQQPRPPPQAEDGFVGGVGLRKLFGGVSAMWAKRQMERDPSFPRPHYVNQYPYWRVGDLHAWWASLPTEPPPSSLEAGERGVKVLRGRWQGPQGPTPPAKPTGRKPRSPKPLAAE
jgi:hypothetical protein